MAALNIPLILDSVVETLRIAGVDATVDPRNLNPPCAWVSAQSLPTGQRTMCGDMPMKVGIYLIAGDSGVPEAYAALNDLLLKALTVLEQDGEIDLATSVSVPTGGGPLPAFYFTITTDSS